MDNNEFRTQAHRLVDWMADYWENVEKYPVMSPVSPGEIKKQLPQEPPHEGISFDKTFADFEKIIMPGVTHWQHPSFFAYFPSNATPPSILGEMLASALAVQGMIWQTSPSAAELEEIVMKWLARMIGLPDGFEGVIQDTASTAGLVSLLTAREKKSDFQINRHGFSGNEKFIVYSSAETHSSIEKDVKIAGFGSDNLRKIEVDDNFAMIPEKLAEAIQEDLNNGLTPLAVIATLGTTGSTAIDPLKEIGEICRRHDIWLHVDAAFGGTALILPEFRYMIDGIDKVDTFVFNPHKWLGVNFDCTAYFVRDKGALIRTFEIMPEYLKTGQDAVVNNYRDWGIQLGRRFRALKLWFVLSSYGISGLQKIIRRHIEIGQWLKNQVDAAHDFELLAPVPFNLVCFRYHPDGIKDENRLDNLNARLVDAVNATGKIFLTHTKLKGRYTVRLVAGQYRVEKRHVETAWDLIRETASKLTV